MIMLRVKFATSQSSSLDPNNVVIDADLCAHLSALLLQRSSHRLLQAPPRPFGAGPPRPPPVPENGTPRRHSGLGPLMIVYDAESETVEVGCGTRSIDPSNFLVWSIV